MTEIRQLLGLSLDSAALARQSEDLIQDATRACLDDVTQRLQALTARLRAMELRAPKALPSVYRLFISTYQAAPERLAQVLASPGQLRVLAYALSYQPAADAPVIIADADMLTAALILFERQWSALYCNGFFYTLLKGWHLESRARLQQFLRHQLASEPAIRGSDGHQVARLLQQTPYFLQASGPVRLAEAAAEAQWPWQQIPGRFDLGPDLLSSSYFATLLPLYAVALVKQGRAEACLDSLLTALDQAAAADRLYVLALLILAVEKFLSAPLYRQWQARLLPVIQRLIGPHDNLQAWEPRAVHKPGEAQSIRNARDIFRKWVIQHFFSFFFESLASDDQKNARYHFWQQYLEYVEDFRIFVNDTQYRKMQRDDQIRPYLGSKIAELREADNNVLVMMLRDFMLIEFSQSGAFYAYNRAELLAGDLPDISKQRMRSSEFKQTQLFRLMDGGLQEYLGPDKARKSHRGHHWQQEIAGWLKQELGCHPQPAA